MVARAGHIADHNSLISPELPVQAPSDANLQNTAAGTTGSTEVPKPFRISLHRLMELT